MPLLSDPKPPSLRSTRALPRILAVLSDKLSPESGSSGGSIFTLLQIIFNKFAVVPLTWLYLLVINPSFLHDKVCSVLNFSLQTIFSNLMQIPSWSYQGRLACLMHILHQSVATKKVNILEPDP